MDDDLGTVTSELDVSGWTANVRIPNQSTAKQVGLASFGGRIYMVHTGSSDANNLYHSRWNGSSWSNDVLVPNQHADGGPAMTVHSNRPTMIYRVAGENRLAKSTWYSNEWTAPVTAGRPLGTNGQIRSAPSVVVHVDGGSARLFVAYCATMSGRDHIFLDSYSPPWNVWVSHGQLDLEGYTCKHPTVYSTGTGLKILFTRHLSSLWYDEWFLSEVTVDPGISSGALRWHNDRWPIGMMTKKPMSVVRCDNSLHLTHGGGDDDPDAIYWTTRGSSDWLADQRVPNQASNGGATMVCHDGRPFMVHNGGTNQLYMSEFVGP